MTPKSKSISRLSLFVISLSIILFISHLNFLTPLFADDFSYSVSFVTKEPFTSFEDVLRSQYLHYFSTNGRSVVHTLAQVLLWIGKPVLNIVNGAAFFTFCLLICFHGLGSFFKIKSWHMLSVFAALWFLTPHFGGSYLWVMGAANYMYSPQIILLFLIPYRLLLNPNYKKENTSPSWLLAIVWAVCGVLAGWTNENTSLALIVIVIMVIVVQALEKQKIFPWMWTGLVGNLVGCAFLFLSPAQGKRLAAAGGFGGLMQWVHRFISISYNVIRYLWLPILIFAVALVFFFLQEKRKRKKKVIDRSSLIALAPAFVFVVGTGISVYSMVGSPEFPVWVWSSILSFCLIAVLNMVAVVDFSSRRLLSHGGRLASAILIAAIAVSYFNVAPELYRVKAAFQEREQLIAIAKSDDSTLVVDRITTKCAYSSYSLFGEISTDATIWPNTAIANYYDLISISARGGN